jgi:nitrite reductase (NO-forming)
VEGGTKLINENIQTTLIPPGGATIVEFKCEVPGTLNIVDHAIFRAFNKGALAQIKVRGDESKGIYSGKQKDEVYLPEGAAVQSLGEEENKPIPERTHEERMNLGKIKFETVCSACHMMDAKGIAGTFPPLAKSDFLMARKDKGIGILLNGLSEKITVNGKEFNGAMPRLQFSDDEIANVLTYVRNSFGNSGGLVTAKEVNKARIEASAAESKAKK